MRTALLILVFVAIAVPVAAIVSARWPLVVDGPHARETHALPFLENDPREQRSGLIQVRVGGFVYRARVAGLANTGPNLLLLHGFPETTIMWDRRTCTPRRGS